MLRRVCGLIVDGIMGSGRVEYVKIYVDRFTSTCIAG